MKRPSTPCAPGTLPARSRTRTGHGQGAFEQTIARFLRQTGNADELIRTRLPDAPTCSVMYGAAGIAYALGRLACSRGDARILGLAQRWLAKARQDSRHATAFHDPEEPISAGLGSVSPYHTASGLECVRAFLARAADDPGTEQDAMSAYIERSAAPCQSADLTLGRSSVLLGCALLHELSATRDCWPVRARLADYGDRLLARLWETVDWHRLRWLGLAHGWAGILYAALRWSRSRALPPPGSIAERLTELARRAEPFGLGSRWPTLSERRDADEHPYWSGWCNGSAGHVFLWSLAWEMLGDDAYLALARKAGWNAWETRAGTHSLCCGDAGRAYALLKLYNHTNDGLWLKRAVRLATDAAVSSAELQGKWCHSLYYGNAGIAVLAADLTQPRLAAMPFFESAVWRPLSLDPPIGADSGRG